MQRSSQQDASDGVNWQSIGIRLGVKGLDLREPAEPDSLTELLNARFVDDRTVRPRYGHTGSLVQDSSDFAPLGDNYSVTDEWVYGHGVRVSSSNAAGWENAHHPIAGRGQLVFSYRDSNVVHTGDRLLVMQDGPAVGASDYWSREVGGPILPQGIPAFLPLETDATPPSQVGGEYVETCLTSKYRAFVDNGDGVSAWILDRATGAVIDHSDVSGTSADPVETKVICSGDLVVVLWRDFTDRQLWMNWWTGASWTGGTIIQNDVKAFDVAVVPGGFHLLWFSEFGFGSLKIGKYLGATATDTPYPFGTTITAPDVPTGAIAVGVAPTGEIGIAFVGDSLLGAQFSEAMVNLDDWAPLGDTTATRGLTICSRGLRNQSGLYSWIVHFGSSDGYTQAMRFETSVDVVTGTKRWNSRLASKSWRVGDEVFCWLRAANAGTHYLVSGCGPQTVCGFADREEAITRTSHDVTYGIPHVMPDPNDEDGVLFTWVRPFNTGQTFGHPGNTRYGDMNFLPSTTAVQFGRSVYLSGSAVRNWDGIELGDAGFQDYPVISGTPTQGTGGDLTIGGTYYYRIYAVRYNARGERFESAAITSDVVTLTASNDKITLAISTLPDTNHDDVVFEVYRTESLGTTFYLDGTVANSLTAATVSYESSLDDDELISQVGDPHSAGVGQLSELESFGPLGCSMLAVSGDRLWGAGGQVTPGFVQFSKLHTDGYGAGFDDLAGFQEINTEGRDVTSLAPQNDATVIFERDRLYVISGIGPDNYGRGAFDIPNIELADGAITHVGTVGTQLGTLYWGQEGPRLLTLQFQVLNIAAPIRSFAEGLTPSGVNVALSREEVVWYTPAGDALLWNYLDGQSRWARWNGLKIAGCHDGVLVTVNGVLLTEDPDAAGDNGRGFAFVFRTGNLRGENILQGATLLRSVGIVGAYEGPHELRTRVFYNGSPLWTDEWTWSPEESTWLAPGDDFSALTPEQVDALKPLDKSGGYITNKRSSRANCHFFRVEVSNVWADGPSYVPHELSLELGVHGGLGRVPVGVFTSNTHR